MKTNQLLVRSAVTIVATGLTLLTSNQSEAYGRGASGMGMSAGHGGMGRGAIQGMSARTFTRAGATTHMNGRNQIGNQGPRNIVGGKVRDDRGGHSERRHGRDDGMRHNAITTRGEREPGDDHGRHRERGDDKRGISSVTRGEREPGDDHGRHRERADDKGGLSSVTRGEREPGDDHGRHPERGDDKGGTR